MKRLSKQIKALSLLISCLLLVSSVALGSTTLDLDLVTSGGFAKGDRGDGVRLLQLSLILEGCLSGEADGIYGSQTVRAVEAFQTQAGLPVDGAATFRSLYVLFSKLASTHNDKVYYGYQNEEGIPETFGMVEWPEGDIYIGEISDGTMFGEGTIVHEDGTIYSGHFIDGEKSGGGIVWFTNGDQYFGDWKNDMMDGNGHYEFAGTYLDIGGQDDYQGEWTNGTMDGNGTYTFPDGAALNGEWDQNQYIGE